MGPTVVFFSGAVAIVYALVCLVASYALGPPIEGAGYWFALTLIATLGALVGSNSARVLLLWVCGLNLLAVFVLMMFGPMLGLPLVGDGSGWRIGWLLMTIPTSWLTMWFMSGPGAMSFFHRRAHA